MMRLLLALALVPVLAWGASGPPVVETGTTTAFNLSASAISCDEPAGGSAGEVYVAVAKMMDDAGHATKTFGSASAGWTRVLQENTGTAMGTRDFVIAVDYAVRGGSALGSTTWTYDGGSTTGLVSCVIFRVSGADTSAVFAPTYDNGLHVVNQINAFTSNVYTGGPPQPITTVRDDTLVFILSSFTSASGTAVHVAPSGYSQLVPITGVDRTLLLHYKTVATAGVETPGNPAHENYVDSTDIRNYTFAIQPPPELGAGVPAAIRRRM